MIETPKATRNPQKASCRVTQALLAKKPGARHSSRKIADGATSSVAGMWV